MTKEHAKDLVTQSLEDPRVRREFEHEWFFDETVIQLEQKMEELGISRSDLANRLGCSPSNVTQLLRHGSNLTVRKLMELALAIDHRFRAPTLEPLVATAPWESYCVQAVEPVDLKRTMWAAVADGDSASLSGVWLYAAHQTAERGDESVVRRPYANPDSGEIHDY